MFCMAMPAYAEGGLYPSVEFLRGYMYPEWLHAVHDYAESTGESPCPSVASTTTSLLPYSRSGLLELALYNATVTNSNECSSMCYRRGVPPHNKTVGTLVELLEKYMS